MLLLVRVDHDTVLRQLRSAQVDAVVGPTNAHGWTAVHTAVDDPALVVPGPVVAYGRAPDLALVVRDGATTLRLSWDLDDAGETVLRGDVDEVVHRLTAWFGAAGDEAAVEHALASVPPDDIRPDRLERVLDLPELDDAPPEQAVLAVRAPENLVMMAAAAAGPTLVVDVGRGWWVLASPGPAPPDETPGWALAEAMTAVARRRDAVLYLARRGTERTLAVATARGIADVGAWSAAWELTLDDSSERYELLARTLGTPDVPAYARAALRRTLDPRGLVELLELFGVPGAVAAELDGTAGTRPVRHVERLGWFRSWWTNAVQAGLRQDWRRDRDLSVGRAWLNVVLVALALLVEGGIAALTIAVIVTDGAVVDADASSGSDLWFLAFVGVLTALFSVLLWRSLVQLRYVRRRNRRPID